MFRRLHPFRHVLRVQTLDLFDAAWYLTQNSDVSDRDVNPLIHYRNHGWREGRWPNPIFDPLWYTQTYSDVAQLGIEPLEHFERYGRLEGRRPCALFDQNVYLRLNPDVAASGIDPCEHYLRYGCSEGRATVEATESSFADDIVEMRDASAIADRAPPEEAIVEAVQFADDIVEMRDASAIADRALPEEAIAEAVQFADDIVEMRDASAIADRALPEEAIAEAVQFANVIVEMRDASAIADRALPEEAIAEAVQALARLDDAGSNWRSRFLAKKIYRVDESLRPVPDGLSYAYLELADTLNDGGLGSGNLTYEDQIMLAAIDPVGAAEALMQRELGDAAKLQSRLLHKRCRQLRG